MPYNLTFCNYNNNLFVREGASKCIAGTIDRLNFNNVVSKTCEIIDNFTFTYSTICNCGIYRVTSAIVRCFAVGCGKVANTSHKDNCSCNKKSFGEFVDHCFFPPWFDLVRQRKGEYLCEKGTVLTFYDVRF